MDKEHIILNPSTAPKEWGYVHAIFREITPESPSVINAVIGKIEDVIAQLSADAGTSEIIKVGKGHRVAIASSKSLLASAAEHLKKTTKMVKEFYDAHGEFPSPQSDIAVIATIDEGIRNVEDFHSSGNGWVDVAYTAAINEGLMSPVFLAEWWIRKATGDTTFALEALKRGGGVQADVDSVESLVELTEGMHQRLIAEINGVISPSQMITEARLTNGPSLPLLELP